MSKTEPNESAQMIADNNDSQNKYRKVNYYQVYRYKEQKQYCPYIYTEPPSQQATMPITTKVRRYTQKRTGTTVWVHTDARSCSTWIAQFITVFSHEMYTASTHTTFSAHLQVQREDDTGHEGAHLQY